MGKNKKPKANLNNPEYIKELGNKAFVAKDYNEAIKQYNLAIDAAKDKPSHVYFANRANAKLELYDFMGCVEDCDQAIKIEPKYAKSYARKARALQFKTKYDDAMATVKKGLEQEPDNADLKEIEGHLNIELVHDKEFPSEHPARKQFNDLFAWCDRENVTYARMRLRFYTANNRGVHAACNVRSGDRIIEVPSQACIKMSDIDKTPVGQQLIAAGFTEKQLYYKQHPKMAIWLLYEKLKKKEDPKYRSPFQEWIDILPPDADDFVVNYSEEDIQLLTGSDHLLKRIRAWRAAHQQDYDLLCSKAPDMKKFSYEDFKFYTLMSNSRLLNLAKNNEYAFVPLADMCNHKNPMECKWYYDFDKDSFCIDAVQDIPFGDPIFLSYGIWQDTSMIFLNYGFVDFDDSKDIVKFDMSLPATNDQDSYHKLKTELIDPSQYTQTFEIGWDLNFKSLDVLIAFARYIVFDGDEVSHLHYQKKLEVDEFAEKLKASGGSGTDQQLAAGLKLAFKGWLPKYDLDNEVKAWKFIKETALAQLAKYPQTLKEDNELLEKDDLTFQKRNMIFLRKKEKDLYHNMIFCAEEAVRLSTMTKKEARLALTKHTGNKKRWERYFLNTFHELLPQ